MAAARRLRGCTYALNSLANGDKHGTTIEWFDSVEVGFAACSAIACEGEDRSVRSMCRAPLEPTHSRKRVLRSDCRGASVPREIESRREVEECSSIDKRDSAGERPS